MKTDRLLGVLGGMGPLATVEFLRKLIEHTPARVDQEHIPCITYSVPQVPCRVTAILDGGPSPLPAMLKGINVLERAGVSAIAIPCVTAHHWFDEMTAATRLPILHIAKATIEVLATNADPGHCVGVLATRATLQAGHFQRSLSEAGYRSVTPAGEIMNYYLLPAIANVKLGNHHEALRLSLTAVENLLERGAGRVILACTELPVALQDAPASIKERCVDTLDALAGACVTWANDKP